MPRRLKTYQTSLGFYDLAIAAPSMKAALEAWGSGSNLFHQGVAKEAEDAEVVAATVAGVVLKRPAGSSGRFADHSELPADLGRGKGAGSRERRRAKPKKRASPKISDKEARKAAQEFEKEQRRREAERRREDAARAKERKKRERAVGKAQAAMDEARRRPEKKASAIEAERAGLDKRAEAEENRWEKQREKLESALRRARD
ncbi:MULTISPECIES: hypothetical protein [Bradyrhizobium]|uniref:hypothetical protein n=1 Tax=Bradyrhizobium elkanii TaxID=29448 RepID=UPI00040EBCAA|nr:hypothetical protein [Bradyrhizobium elkanii]